MMIQNTIQAKIYEEIKNMTSEEEITYRRKKLESGPMSDL